MEPTPIDSPKPTGEGGPAPKHSTKLAWILLAIILILGSGIGGFFLGKQITRPLATPIPMTVSSTPTPDPTSNWKSYSNAEFTFKYPSEWLLDTNNKKITSANPKVVLWAFGSGDPIYNECMKLDSSVTSGELMIKTFSRVSTGEACNGLATNAREKWVTKAGGDGSAPGIQYEYDFTQKEAAELLFNQILSTFKFARLGNQIILGQSISKVDSANNPTNDPLVDMVIPLPTGATFNTQSRIATIQSVKYDVNIGSSDAGLCPMDDSDPSCGYTDSTDVKNIITLRLWSNKGGTNAINPMEINVNGYGLHKIIILKYGENSYFSQAEIGMWKDLLSKITTTPTIQSN